MEVSGQKSEREGQVYQGLSNVSSKQVGKKIVQRGRREKGGEIGMGERAPLSHKKKTFCCL